MTADSEVFNIEIPPTFTLYSSPLVGVFIGAQGSLKSVSLLQNYERSVSWVITVAFIAQSLISQDS